MFRFILITIILLQTLDASADAGCSGKAKITKLYAVTDEQLLVKLSDNANPNKCNISSDGDLLINPRTQVVFYNLLLSAHFSGRDVNIYLMSQCGTTHWQGPSFGAVGHVVIY